MNNTYEIYLISDSTGETLDRIFLALKAQFKNIEYKVHQYSFTRTENQILKTIDICKKKKNLIIFSDFKKSINKTKEMNLLLKKFEATNSLVILDKMSKENIYRSAKNIPHVKITDVNHFSAFDIVKFKKIIFTESSIKELEKRYS